MNAWEIVKKEFSCDCDQAEVRRRTQKNGVTVACYQCTSCGRPLGNIKKSELKPGEFDRLSPFDESLHESWNKQMTDRYKQLNSEQDEEWWAKYNRYLETPAWAEKRQRALRRDNHTCQGCLRAPAVHVHHLSYDRVFKEMLFDLVSVCKECHDQIHDQ